MTTCGPKFASLPYIRGHIITQHVKNTLIYITKAIHSINSNLTIGMVILGYTLDFVLHVSHQGLTTLSRSLILMQGLMERDENSFNQARTT